MSTTPSPLLKSNPKGLMPWPDPATRFHISRVCEAVLFASNGPVSFEQLRILIETIAPLKPRELKAILGELQHDYAIQKRAFRLEEQEEGYWIRSASEYAPYIEHLLGYKKPDKLSHAATETLAIIAYRQPITKAQIESIRGVDSSGTLQGLIERGFVSATGRLESPGRPTLYGITPFFLESFGLKDLSELPPLTNN